MDDPRPSTRTRGASAAPAPVPPPTVVEGLKRLYNAKIKPLEKAYNYEYFHSPLLEKSDFDARPIVLLLGQYSVGKTSFIRYLLGRDFPNQRIGPEPTTDRFVAVMNGPIERSIPGNALCVQDDMPFRGLTKFGTSFLNRFEASILPCEILEKVIFVDTPGVLSGEKQRIGRSYNFVDVVEWFAERADMILLLFDAHKLDISDEFKRTIATLKGHEDKVRVVLNKADRVNHQQLMRVYGALMWSLGKVSATPEVMRVYISSFWEEPFMHKDNSKLFEAERNDLLTDLRNLPRNAAVRKVNELVKRARLAKVHAYIISYLRSQMPTLWGKDAKQRELIDNLNLVFYELHKKHHLPVGDFPEMQRMKEMLAHCDFKKFAKLNQRLIDSMDEVLSRDIPRLMRQLGQEHFVSGLSEEKTEAFGGAGTGPTPPGFGLGAGGAGAGGGGDAGGLSAGGIDLGGRPDYTMPDPSGLSNEQARVKLVDFYTRYNPAKLHAVDAILREYHGRYGVLFRSLEARYGRLPEPTAPPAPVSSSAPPPLPAPRAPAKTPEEPASSAPPPAPSRSAPPPVPAAAPSPAAPAASSTPPVASGADDNNPFGSDDEEEVEPLKWALEPERSTYAAIFESLNPTDGKLSGKACKPTLVASKLARPVLKKVWRLADVDNDGFLELEEFCVAMHLITVAQGGDDLPDELPAELVPPSKR